MTASWRERCIPVEDAAALVKPGDQVFVGSACATPRTVVAALEKPATAPAGVRLVHFLTDGVVPQLGAGPFTSFQHRTFFVGRDMTEIPSDKVEYIPLSLAEVPSLLRSGRIHIDVAIVQVGPPDADGRCSLGVSVDIAPAALDAAAIRIAEVNPSMPRTNGETSVDVAVFDALVEADAPVIEYVHEDVGPVAQQVARYVARLVPDGATLQVGLGRVPNHMLTYLTDRRDLGIHSDVITDSVMHLAKSGAVSGSQKSTWPEKIVASWAMGTRALYDFLDNNEGVYLAPIERVCDPETLRSTDGLVSVTQAFAVDLTGQVCADTFDGMLYGGVSTQPDLHRAATQSRNGRAIVCLASTMPDGSSAIKVSLHAGEAVAIPRADIRWIVSEYGTAFLFGRSLRERAVSLMEIAHPDHRDALLQEAIAAGLVPEGQKLRSRTAYPGEEERDQQLRDGTVVRIRPTRTTDAPLLQDLFYRLRPEDVRTRFFRKLSSLRLDMAEHLCSVSYDDEMAFVAVVGDREDETVIAASCYYLDRDTRFADVAYMVDPAWQGKGLGQALQEKTTDYAMRHDVRGFTADVLAENEAMLAVLAKGPYEMQQKLVSGAYEVRMSFAPAS